MTKKFSEVFSNINISTGVKTNFRNSYVKSVKFNSDNKAINICLENGTILNESYIYALENDIVNAFDYVKKANVSLKYNTDNISDSDIIERYWGNMMFFVKSKSNICFRILQDSTYKITNGKIEFSVEPSVMLFLRAKDIGGEIQKLYKERFEKDIKILFSAGESKETTNDSYNERLAEAVKSIPAVTPSETETEPAHKVVKTRAKIKMKTRIQENSIPIKDTAEGEKAIIEGKIIDSEVIKTKKGKYIVRVDITDKSDSMSFKFFTEPETYADEYKDILKNGNYVKVRGVVTYDEYSKDVLMMAYDICQAEIPEPRKDEYPEKRVELHLHTQMSMLDGITNVKEYIKRAKFWGHKAIAVTDHGVVQAFPDAMDEAEKSGIKVVYGVEAYLVDDLTNAVQNIQNQTLDDEFVVFDIETTGLSPTENKIIEIGAVKIRNGEIIDTFSEFINIHEPLPEKITQLTSITDEMLAQGGEEKDILEKFFDFFGNSVLVAHNAKFDVGFIKQWAKRNSVEVKNTVVDTLGLARALFPDWGKFTLDNICKKLGISLENHHRAVDDAGATANIFIKFRELFKEKNISSLSDVSIFTSENTDVKKLKYYHAIILVKTQEGMRNLYELISESHIKYFFKRPRIPKSRYLKFKEGLIIGTACEAGEFFKAVLNNESEERIKELIDFYDYLEIQPLGNNEYLINDENSPNVKSFDDLANINKRITEYGEKYGKLVVATCDSHFIDPEDECYRRLIMDSLGFKDADKQAPLYFRTTEEMLKEFEYLGEEKAKEVVITNTNLIADMTGNLLPIPKETFPPKIEGAVEELIEITDKRAKEIYGEPLPKIVADRLSRERDSIIKHGFAVLYVIAKRLVWDSMEHGYIVGSRGSVGSSFVATMAGITEVNPLPPHYICENCRYSDFDSEDVIANAGNSGFDLPDKLCPKCGKPLSKNGHDIPFETFLGFNGDKEPDIDLNFSGEYQQQAHKYCETLFGEGNVFKAGTIGTLKDKTIYGYAKKYAEARGLTMKNAEINRLIKGCVGVKRTTGQHPGGLMIVPNDKSIYEFCPVQRPANDVNSDITTTHFDYHSISGRLLKLDMLGHDVPTIIRMFQDITGIDPLTVPLDDKRVLSLFTSPKELGLTEEELGCNTGTYGLPEFGTPFVRQMLMDTKPSTFSELVRISGLSHGTDVWFNNAQELVQNGVATLKEVIPTRDDIMVYLRLKGVEDKTAFTIMEMVRKGKGLTPEYELTMREHNVPEWYIESCKRIKYMFPKGHAVAYVTNTVRIGYFKIYYPYAFYSAIFSVKVEEFDYEKMCFGIEKVQAEMKRIKQLGKSATAKDETVYTILELVNELYLRGLKFVPMNLYESDAKKFKVTDEGLMPPLCTIQGLGISVAQNIVDERENGEFPTIENLCERTRLTKTVVRLLKDNGVLGNMPETNQLTLDSLM